ncbi:MAG: DUF3857 domain-containing protein [Chryseolinea sp.]
MKFSRSLFLICFCLTGFVLSTAAFTPYEWEKERARYKLSVSDDSLSELILKQHTQYDYVLENNQFIMYSTLHRIVYVNNSEAIQKHNRIVISMNNTLELLDVRARAITREGRSFFFDKSNLKELKDEESGDAFKIFAIEGIEIGSEVEYFFTRKMSASIFDRVFMQFDVPVKQNSLIVTCPKHLKFDFRSYFEYPPMKEELRDDVNIYSASMQNVPALKTETLSYYSANRKRIEFKLAYNLARSESRLYTWDEAARTFYKILTTNSKDDQKALDKFVKSLRDDAKKSNEDRIKHVENKIKTLVQVNKESSGDAVTQLAPILKFKVASHQGMTSLFLNVFQKLNINCQPVITCSRESIKFDGSFDSWAFLDDYLLYFPDTRKFLEPYVFELRYPLVQADFTAQQGLFIEPAAQSAEGKSVNSSIGIIPPAEYSVNVDNLDIDVTFSQDLSSNRIRQKREFGGYNASYLTPYYDLMSSDQRSNMIEEITKQTAPDATIKEWKASKLNGAQSNNFQVDVDFQSGHFIEKAGSRVLFKVGELIGRQIEMYRDNQRVTTVENEFNRMYNRIIRVHMPAGYQVRNLKDLSMDISYKDHDFTPFVFKSEHSMTGDVLEIRIEEFYKEIFAPLSRYEDFRKVVNAAADFNKITLVLEKRPD